MFTRSVKIPQFFSFATDSDIERAAGAIREFKHMRG